VSDVFEVGQKVRHDGRGEVEITYGPFTNTFGATRYVIRLEDGRETYSGPDSLSAIPTPPAFAVGDEVTYAYGRGGKLVAGPFTSEYHDDPIWVVEKPNGTHMTPTQNSLTKVEKPVIQVGDRVRVVEDDPHNLTGEYVGKVGVLTADHSDDGYDDLPYVVRFGDGTGGHGTPNGKWCVKAVEPVTDEDTYEHDGVIYDLSAKYTDKDGDDWTFGGRGIGPDDTPNGAMNDCAGGGYSYTLGYAHRHYGPLTRVTD
jgi:hypothetical protein